MEQFDHLSAADRQLASLAMEKMKRGESPAAVEAAALKRVERTREEQLRWRYYQTIPKRHWEEMSGRQRKVIAEQAIRYGLPLADRVIDLPKVVRALHDFLARNSHKFSSDSSGDPLLAGGESPALEEYRRHRARLASMEADEKQGLLVNITKLKPPLLSAMLIIRRAGERLDRQFGKDAAQILTDAVTEAQDSVMREFGPVVQEKTPTVEAGDRTGGK